MIIQRINELNTQLDMTPVKIRTDQPGNIENDIYQYRVIIRAALFIARIFTVNKERRAKINMLIHLCST